MSWIAKVKDSSNDAQISYIRLADFGVHLVRSAREATQWDDSTEAWKYAEMAGEEFGMAFVAIPKWDNASNDGWKQAKKRSETKTSETVFSGGSRQSPPVLVRAFDAAIDDVNKVERTMVARVNTATLDRFNSVIEPKGARLEAYRKNPVVLWEHGKDPRRFTDPIGRNVWIRHGGGERPTEILAKTRFLEDDFSQQRFEWYRDGTLNAFSIRAMPEEYGPPTKEELRARPELSNDRPNETRGQFDGPLIYRRWELAEYSGTSVPGTPDALVADRAGRLLDLVSRNLITLPDDIKPIVEEKARAVEPPSEVEPILRYIKHEGDKWIVYSEAGKKLGEFDSEEAAKKRLKQIEYFKHHDDKGRSFEAIFAEIAIERQAMKDAIRGEITALVDLLVHGRV